MMYYRATEFIFVALLSLVAVELGILAYKLRVTPNDVYQKLEVIKKEQEKSHDLFRLNLSSLMLKIESLEKDSMVEK